MNVCQLAAVRFAKQACKATGFSPDVVRRSTQSDSRFGQSVVRSSDSCYRASPQHSQLAVRCESDEGSFKESSATVTRFRPSSLLR
jgi:hypothetical protein